jgi:flagellar protein FlaG
MKMSTNAVFPAGTPEPQGAAPVRSPAEDVAGQGAGRSPEADSADLRLVIEEDKAAGSFVYKTVDARTGKVVQQLPREEVLRLKGADAYSPGALIDARS